MSRTKSVRQRAWSQRQQRRLSRVEQAQKLSLQLLSGNCVNYPKLWNDCETAHLNATKARAAQQAAELAFQLCQDCPVRDRCQEWATVDRYTGLAAGQVWVDGQPYLDNHTRYRPQAA